MSETVTISKDEYERLLKRDDWLGWLEAAGVDSSEAWGYAHELRAEAEGEEE